MNVTTIDYFIIKGISDIPALQCLAFILVLLIYLITLTGNMTIFILVCLDHHLHVPMYFFLANLSILDMSSSIITLHNVLVNFISGDNTISVFACLTQMYIFASLTCNELFLLTVMSYDRYVAICNPLYYHVIMNHRNCTFLAIFCWLLGFIQVFPVLVSFSFFNCYRTREINHFFCDPVLLENLLCNYSYFVWLFIHLGGVFDATFPPFFTFLPYIFIIVTIQRMRSNTSRRKTFYTCFSHLTVVIFLYVTLICQYLRPTSVTNMDTNKLFSLFNTAAVPMLNPLIYSLKNKEMKTALKRKINDLSKLFGEL
ncbi:olfactory receptor 8K3-like [Pseudophryne corroboree]|uniref:olfactory receptor 8K3-like n=1 Tax=Pseudophryne corroboree TaxID=495146 RepID=UPI0030818E16